MRFVTIMLRIGLCLSLTIVSVAAAFTVAVVWLYPADLWLRVGITLGLPVWWLIAARDHLRLLRAPVSMNRADGDDDDLN